MQDSSRIRRITVATPLIHKGGEGKNPGVAAAADLRPHVLLGSAPRAGRAAPGSARRRSSRRTPRVRVVQRGRLNFPRNLAHLGDLQVWSTSSRKFMKRKERNPRAR